MSWSKPLKLASLLFALAIWVVVVGFPLGILLSTLTQAEQRLLLWDPSLLSVVRATVYQAFLSAAFSSVLGLGLGLWVGSLADRRVRTRIQAFLTFPYGVPSVVVASAWVFWLGRSGLISRLLEAAGAGLDLPISGVAPVDWLYSFRAVILAQVFLNMPWVAMMVAEARSRISKDEIEAATDLGAGPRQVFFQIVWPQVGWALFSAYTQVFTFCSMSFALVLILGGGPPVQTLETEIYQRIRFGSMDLGGAAACAVWQLLVTLGPASALLLFKNRLGLGRPPESGGSHYWHENQGSRMRTKRGLTVLCVAVFAIFPYFPILNPVQVFSTLTGPVRSVLFGAIYLSLEIACFSSFLAVLIAVLFISSLDRLSAWPRVQQWGMGMILLPGSTSALVLGMSVWLAYEKWVDWLRFPVVGMIFLQVTLFYPFVFRTLWPLTRNCRNRLLEPAQDLGASGFQLIRWIQWPFWKGPLLLSFFGVVGASLGEIAAISFFSTDEALPLPVLASQLIEQYHFEEAAGVSGILFILAFFFTLGSVLFQSRRMTHDDTA